MFKLYFVFPLQKVLNVIFKAFFLKTETFDDLKFNFFTENINTKCYILRGINTVSVKQPFMQRWQCP